MSVSELKNRNLVPNSRFSNLLDILCKVVSTTSIDVDLRTFVQLGGGHFKRKN